MTWQEAIEILAARPRFHAKYRWLCSDENPNVAQREAYRRNAILKATGRWPTTTPVRPAVEPKTTSLGKMAGNAAAAIVRLGIQFFAGGNLLVDETELDRRLATCTPCEQWTGSRCVACGCFGQLKARLESERGQCPEGKW